MAGFFHRLELNSAVPGSCTLIAKGLAWLLKTFASMVVQISTMMVCPFSVKVNRSSDAS